MIQVCTRCGTRWNVRDQQRQWCPRCSGTLGAPQTEGPYGGVQRPVFGPPGAVPRLPPGFRWIAVRPGAAPRVRRPRRPLGPTPRYAVIPRWGLVDPIDPGAGAGAGTPGAGPSASTVRLALRVTQVVLAVAALAYLLQYVLLVINRGVLLHPAVAGTGLWLALLASAAAIAAVIVCAVLLTQWLTARRTAAFAQLGRAESRQPRALRAGCLVPLVNLLAAPVYVIELAVNEGHYSRLRKPIRVWWMSWVAATAVAIFATATRWTSEAQGIADNTATMVLAYLLALVTVRAAARVFDGFELRPIARPAHRWVVIADDRPATLESEGREPAA